MKCRALCRCVSKACRAAGVATIRPRRNLLRVVVATMLFSLGQSALSNSTNPRRNSSSTGETT